jgi:hypothetical protein
MKSGKSLHQRIFLLPFALYAKAASISRFILGFMHAMMGPDA